MEPKKNKFLIKTLYGILFILPQDKLYNSLFKRIKHIEVIIRTKREDIDELIKNFLEKQKLEWKLFSPK